MREELSRKAFHEAIDTALSGLKGDPKLARRILDRESMSGSEGKKRFSAGLALALVLTFAAVTALAWSVITAVFSPRVDAYAAADRALEEKYGLTPSMLGFFSRDQLGNDERRFTVEYEPRSEDALASKLGTYRVVVADGAVESVRWSLDGADTFGGFDADAWGAEQLGEMVRITAVTHDTSRFQRKAAGEETDLYAGMGPAPAGNADESFPEADRQIEEEMKLYRREVEEAGRSIEARSRFTRDELIEMGRQGIIAAYALDEGQRRRLTFFDTDYFIAYYTTIGADQRPTFHMTFQLWSDDIWQDGDGVYTVDVNVLDGTIEYLDYDTTLDGNG